MAISADRLYMQDTKKWVLVMKDVVCLEKVGVVHRNLRAANVLVDEVGFLKIAYFGLTEIQAFDQKFVEGGRHPRK
ncbi:hypothetical protein TcWFU_000666 [Taenia crassiceps]|uniref:Protein kinase domain-containing protein n=1 Tax=Taenia crassiceps TaxID=6207 RepID=A0ABR4Q8T9_9CEST